jgi:hypothetical protein
LYLCSEEGLGGFFFFACGGEQVNPKYTFFADVGKFRFELAYKYVSSLPVENADHIILP